MLIRADELREVTVVNEKTGAKKGKKLQRFSLIPRDFLWQLATHYGKGAMKYGDRNWEAGYDWSLTVDAAERHFNEFIMAARAGDNHGKYDHHNDGCPTDCKEHTGSHHLIAAAWHLIALYIFDTRDLGTNDLGN